MSHGHGSGPIDPGFYPADPEYGLTPSGSTYEHTDAHTGTIAKFMFWLVVTAVLTHVGIGVMYRMLIAQGEGREAVEISSPLAVGQEPRLPPVPRLQASPANEFYEYRRRESALLNNYGWANKDRGTVHIPIADAMRLTVERGLAARPADPAGMVGLMPSDSSAGRVMERRRQ